MTWHGLSWTADRRPPDLRGIKEPPTPRLCVAASVARCFAARLFIGDVFVYRTESPRRAVKPRGVNDSPITQERWLIPPVPMVMLSIIPSLIVWQACGRTWDRMRAKLKRYPDASFTNMPPGPSSLEKLTSFREAIDALGDEFCTRGDRQFVEAAIKYFEIQEAA